MSKVMDCALRLLTRREHSAYELAQKLKQKGFFEQEIKEVIESCQQLNMQSDERFVESFIRVRVRQGYGPLRIHQELQGKGVDVTLIAQALKAEASHWLTHVLRVLEKKCNGLTDFSFDELQKYRRFLLYRGFDMDIITLVMKEYSSSGANAH